jgi:hypothetical protein
MQGVYHHHLPHKRQTKARKTKMGNEFFWREESEKGWSHTEKPKGPVLYDALQIGCLMRIADAVEKMAEDRVDLERRLQFYKDCCERSDQRNKTYQRRIASLRGWITRLKKQANKKPTE